MDHIIKAQFLEYDQVSEIVVKDQANLDLFIQQDDLSWKSIKKGFAMQGRVFKY